MPSGSSLAPGSLRVLCRHAGLLTFLLTAVPSVQGQTVHPPVPVDTLRAADYDAETFVPPALIPGKGVASATIVVNYEGFTPEAEAAFEYAASIWETHIRSSVTIRVEATFEPLGDNVLGAAGPRLVGNFPQAARQNTWYAAALAEAIAGSNFTGTSADIVASFNSGFQNWYFGTDGNTPRGQYDFATVVLHELGHGLGFRGSFEVEDDDPTTGNGCPGGEAGSGCWGVSTERYPLIYDRFTEDGEGVSLLNESVYPNPSRVLGDVLQGGRVFFDGPAARTVRGDVPIDLYAPANFELGSSYSHLDEQAFPPGDPNSLMTPFLGRAEAIHSPGAVTCAMFQDIGWSLGDGCFALISPGLILFEAERMGDTVQLRWRTSSGASIVRFEVQRRYLDEPFETIEVIPAQSSPTEPQDYSFSLENLKPGPYTFRLRQVYEDDVFVSEELDVFIELEGDVFVDGPGPSPTRGPARLRVLVDVRQPVRVEVYDALGRRVAQLFDNTLSREDHLEMTIETDGWAPGVYFVHVAGRSFTTTRSLVVVR